MFADDQVCIVFTAGVFTGQTFVLSSEVNHDLRPLIHQLAMLLCLQWAGLALQVTLTWSVHYSPVVSVSQLI